MIVIRCAKGFSVSWHDKRGYVQPDIDCDEKYGDDDVLQCNEDEEWNGCKHLTITHIDIIEGLCGVGIKLWKASSGLNYLKSSYSRYCDHIRECATCRIGLLLEDLEDE